MPMVAHASARVVELTERLGALDRERAAVVAEIEALGSTLAVATFRRLRNASSSRPGVTSAKDSTIQGSTPSFSRCRSLGEEHSPNMRAVFVVFTTPSERS
jgi:hypothetical protein